MSQKVWEKLTEAEKRVLRMALTLSNDEIARELGNSTRTVEAHIRNARGKLGGLPRRTAARLLHEAEEHSRFLPTQFPAIDQDQPVPAANGIDQPASVPNRVNEGRVTFEPPPLNREALLASKGADHAYFLGLIKVTLTVSLAALLVGILAFGDKAAAIFQRLADHVEKFTWY